MFKLILVTLLSASLAVSQRLLHPDTVLDDFFNIKGDFFHNQFDRIRDVAKSPFIGLDSDHVKKRLDSYLDHHKHTLSLDIDKYVDYFKNGDDKGTDLWASYMPTGDPESVMKNPYLELSVPALIGRNGYDCEIHVVVSQGYILNVHRIPRGKNSTKVSKNTVILQHGLFDSSYNWIINGPNRSLGYVLADAGFDVWMTNVRGNIHAREHAWYKTDSKEFWNFSFHEIAQYDIPAVIEHIKKVKGPGTKIAYIGHSMGTAILFAMLSLRPDINDELSAGIALAPTVYLSHITSPMRNVEYLAPLANAAKWIHSYEVFPREFHLAMSSACQSDFGKTICRELIFNLIGHDDEQVNKTVVSRFWIKGNGASWKTLLHLAQLLTTGVFKQFDYGRPEYNRKVYGSETPPEYELSNIKLGITLFWAKNDFLSNEQDVYILHEKVPSTKLYLVDNPNFNHVDYVWATDAPKLVNEKVLEIFREAMPGNNNN